MVKISANVLGRLFKISGGVLHDTQERGGPYANRAQGLLRESMGQALEVYTSDNGTEFFNKKIADICSRSSIMRQ